MRVRPAKTQISLGIRPVWSESPLSAWRKLGSLATQLSAQRRLWSDWADAQADLSLRWAHSHFVALSCRGSFYCVGKIPPICIHVYTLIRPFSLFQNLALGKASTDDKCHFEIVSLFSEFCCCCCLFGVYVAFNNFSVISRRCLVATGSSVLTFVVLPHCSIMPQTLDMISHPVTLSWHLVDQS